MRRILVLFAHPNFQKSRVQRSWLTAISGLSGVTVRDLYQLYPDFDVDPRAEQQALESHDLIVLQHPMYWYSTPALLKQWQDLVLEHGWAYGKNGNALEGKPMLCAVSTGGKAEAYEPGGFHGITVHELLAPIRQTARLCKMNFLPPFVGYGAFSMNKNEIEHLAQEYATTLEALRDDQVDLEALRDQKNLQISSQGAAPASQEPR